MDAIREHFEHDWCSDFIEGISLCNMYVSTEGNKQFVCNICQIFLAGRRYDMLDFVNTHIAFLLHYKENTKKWLGFLTKIGSKVH